MNVIKDEDRGTHALACALAALVGAVFTFVCFYPGYMSNDSIDQLAQARDGVFNDWHPPIMSWVWRPLDRLYPGPAGMLAFHNLLFWSGLGLFCHLAIESSILAPLAILIVGFFPPVFALLSTIWKDVGLGASLVLATALLLRAQRRKSKPSLALSLLPLFYGLAVRHNAGAAVLPLVVWAAFIGLDLFNFRKSRAQGIGAGLAVFSVMSALVVSQNLRLIQGRLWHIYQATLVHDLAAISMADGVMRLPECALDKGKPADVAGLAKIYSPYHCSLLYQSGENGEPHLNMCSGRDIGEILRAWSNAVRDHPGAYLRHRWRLFSSLINLSQRAGDPYMTGIVPNALGIRFRRTQLNAAVMACLSYAKGTFFFRSWIYVAALLVILPLGTVFPSALGPLIFAVGTSGLLYDGFNILAAPCDDFRYNWWTILAALLLAPVGLEELAARVHFKAPRH